MDQKVEIFIDHRGRTFLLHYDRCHAFDHPRIPVHHHQRDRQAAWTEKGAGQGSAGRSDHPARPEAGCHHLSGVPAVLYGDGGNIPALPYP